MNRTAMLVIVLIVYSVYAALKHKEVWHKLTVKQISGVVLTFILLTGIGGVFLYYWMNLVMDIIPNDIVSIILQFISAIMVVVFGVVFFNIIIAKITNGILPVKNTYQ